MSLGRAVLVVLLSRLAEGRPTGTGSAAPAPDPADQASEDAAASCERPAADAYVPADTEAHDLEIVLRQAQRDLDRLHGELSHHLRRCHQQRRGALRRVAQRAARDLEEAEKELQARPRPPWSRKGSLHRLTSEAHDLGLETREQARELERVLGERHISLQQELAAARQAAQQSLVMRCTGLGRDLEAGARDAAVAAAEQARRALLERADALQRELTARYAQVRSQFERRAEVMHEELAAAALRRRRQLADTQRRLLRLMPGRLWGRLFQGADARSLELDESKFEQPRLHLWAASDERDWYLARRPSVWIFALIGLGAVAWAVGRVAPGEEDGFVVTDRSSLYWPAVAAVTGLGVLVYCTFPYFSARRAYRDRLRQTAAYQAEMALADLREDERLPLHKLFALNRKQLDAYQELSRRQQRQAYLLSQVSSVVGLLVLVAGIALSLEESPASEKYVVAGLTGLGAVLSAYISHTFLENARRADHRLGLYYLEPHMLGRVLAGERLTHMPSPDGTEELRRLLATQLMQWPIPDGKDGPDPGTPPAGTEKGASGSAQPTVPA